jgi:hypothetical protein
MSYKCAGLEVTCGDGKAILDVIGKGLISFGNEAAGFPEEKRCRSFLLHFFMVFTDE